MTEHDRLDSEFFVVMPEQPEQLEDSEECQLEEEQRHSPVSSRVS